MLVWALRIFTPLAPVQQLLLPVQGLQCPDKGRIKLTAQRPLASALLHLSGPHSTSVTAATEGFTVLEPSEPSSILDPYAENPCITLQVSTCSISPGVFGIFAWLLIHSWIISCSFGLLRILGTSGPGAGPLLSQLLVSCSAQPHTLAISNHGNLEGGRAKNESGAAKKRVHSYSPFLKRFP